MDSLGLYEEERGRGKRAIQGDGGDCDDPDHGGQGPDQGISSFMKLERPRCPSVEEWINK